MRTEIAFIVLNQHKNDPWLGTSASCFPQKGFSFGALDCFYLHLSLAEEFHYEEDMHRTHESLFSWCYEGKENRNENLLCCKYSTEVNSYSSCCTDCVFKELQRTQLCINCYYKGMRSIPVTSSSKKPTPDSSPGQYPGTVQGQTNPTALQQAGWLSDAARRRGNPAVWASAIPSWDSLWPFYLV